MPRVEPGVLEGLRDGARVHPLRAAAHHTPSDVGGVDRLTGRGQRGERSAQGAPGRGHLRPRIRGADSERTAARALCDGPRIRFIAGPEFRVVRTQNLSTARA